MPGRKRTKGSGGGGKRARVDVPEKNPLDLEEMELDQFDDDDIALNRVKRVEEGAFDARRAYKEEGKDEDAGAGADVDVEEMQIAEEEQMRRIEELDEADFDLEVEPATKPKSSKRKETTRDLEALTKFLNQAEATLEAEPVAVDHSSLTPDAKAALLKQTAPELTTMLQEFREKLTTVKDTISPILQKVRDGELPTSAGVSFLEMKMQLFISYLMHLTFYFLLKAEGKPVQDSPVVKKLVELRAYIDKLKPIEKKLQHQISRLLSRAAIQQSGGVAVEADRANVAALGDVEQVTSELYSAPRGGGAGLSKEEKAAREQRRLTVAGKNREMAEESMMQRTATTRKTDKLLKNAAKMNLADTDALEAGEDEEANIDASIMDMVRSRGLEKKLDDEIEEDEDEDEDGEEAEEEDEEQAMAKKFYEEEMKRAEGEKKRKKRVANSQRQHGGKYKENFGEREGEVIDGHRKISTEITRNKGLVPARPKKFKNPRVRSKYRATKLKNKVKAQTPTSAHLRTDVVRSVPMKN